MNSLSVPITGAASGIGAATAQLAAERRHRVVARRHKAQLQRPS
jgi:NAD(P)-dependent dehydrogenase (short-subunit alcohol dehydrogenase family)